MTQTMIGPNPNTTANAKSLLWAAARKGKAQAAAKVRRLQARGQFTSVHSAALVAGYDAEIRMTEHLSADYYRLAAGRAYVIAARS